MYLAFDTETSGIHTDAQVLTAYFIILDYNFNEIDSLDLKIKYPVYSIQLKAFEVNNIDLIKHEQDAIISLDAKIKLKNFLLKHKKNKYIPLGHNIKYDLYKMKSFGIYDHVSSIFNLDTMQIAQFFKSCNKLPFNHSLSLQNLTDYFGIKPIGKLHNAECDIRLTIDLFKHFQTILNTTIQNTDLNTTILNTTIQNTTIQNTDLNTTILNTDLNTTILNTTIQNTDLNTTIQNTDLNTTIQNTTHVEKKSLRKRKLVKYF